MRALLSFAAALLCGAVLADDTRLSIYAPADFEPDVFEPANETLARSDLPGYALVRENITLDLARGINSVRFDQVSRKLDPSSVTLAPVDAPVALKILSQQFENDVVNPARLLDLYVGRRIQLDTTGRNSERLVGTLLGVNEGVTLQTDDGQVRTFREYAGITFADIPGGLITRPSLIWQIDSPAVAFQVAELSYLTSGLSWWADYTVTLAPGEQCKARLSAWANIANASGRSFADAQVELVHARAQLLKARSGTPQSQSFSLDRSTDLPTGSVKQLPLLPPQREYPCERVLALESSPTWRPSAPITTASATDATTAGALKQLRILNLSDGGRSITLPGGRVRVQQTGADGALSVAAWDRVSASARANVLKIELGTVDDVKISRKINDFSLDEVNGTLQEAIQLDLSNSSDVTQTLRVRENLYRWRSWAIPEASMPFERISASAIEFKVELAAKAKREIRLVVRYQWSPTPP
jgi:hypothetical protein